MKTLYIVRHAKSSWKYNNLTDAERPLNKRGKSDAPEMGKRLKKRGVHPHLMLSSPANRALTTCKFIAKAIDYPAEAIETDESLYHAGEDDLLEIIQDTDDTWDSLMIFGHNPGFTEFANLLTGTDIDNIPTCGILGCTFDVEYWDNIDYGKGSLLFYDFPKNK